MTPRCVFPDALSAGIIRHMTVPAWRSSSALSLVPSTSRVKNIPLPLTAQVLPSPQSNRDWARTHSTSFPLRHLLIPTTCPLGTVRASVIHRQHRSRRTPLYRPGAHKSDYAPFEQRPRTRDRQASGVNLSPAVLASTIPCQPHHLPCLRPCPSVCPRHRLPLQMSNH